MKTERTPSNHSMPCSECSALLPVDANFCSSCGKQIKQRQNGELDTHTQHIDGEAQEQEAKTIRLTSLPQISLKRWLSYQSLKSHNDSGRTQESNPSLQDEDEVPTKSTSSSQGMASIDSTELLESEIRVKPVLASPTTPASSRPKTSELTLIRSNVLWPIIIMLSALAAGLVNFVFTGLAIRPMIVFWFLFVCPGMVLVRFLRLKEPVVEWTLAIALSFAIDTFVAAIFLYAGRWSPEGILSLLIVLNLGGALVQLVALGPLPILRVTQHNWSTVVSLGNKVFRLVGLAPKRSLVNPLSKGLSSIASKGKTTRPLPKLQPTAPTRKHHVLVPVLLTLFMGVIVGASLWSNEVFHGTSSPALNSVLSHTPTFQPDPTSTVGPAPSAFPSARIAEVYQGTIYDLSANMSTKMSLMGIQQTQRSIRGSFFGLHRTGMFTGTIGPAKRIQFTVKDAAGVFLFSFEGDMQSGGVLSGNYCSLDQQAHCTGDYGLWSVAS